MSVHSLHTQSTMNTKEMALSFSPIILFSIVLPLIDIVTDLRMIFILFSTGFVYCIDNYEDISISDRDYVKCMETNLNHKEAFCQNQPNLCKFITPNNFATLFLGKYKNII